MPTSKDPEDDPTEDPGRRSPSYYTFSSAPERIFTVGEKIDLETVRETTRSRLAQALVYLLIVVSLLLIVLTALGSLSIDSAKDLAGAVLSPLIAVTGTALGFYFGGHHGSK